MFSALYSQTIFRSPLIVLHYRAILCMLLIVGGYTASNAQVFFADSDRSGYYDSGLAFVTAPSVLAQAGPTGDKWPTSRDGVLVGEDALQLTYTSNAGGDWSALALAPGFAAQNLASLERLGFWIFLDADAGVEPTGVPDLFLEVGPGNAKTNRINLADAFEGASVTAGSWAFVSLPLSAWRDDAANAGLDFSQVKAVIFGQGEADGQSHRYLIDQVQAYDTPEVEAKSVPAVEVQLNYPLHRELELASSPPATSDFIAVEEMISDGSDELKPRLFKLVDPSTQVVLDWYTGADREPALAYRTSSYQFGQPEFGTNATPLYFADNLPIGDDDELYYDMVQRSTLRYFWDFAHPVSGLARERNTSLNTVTSGGSGFGIMAWLVGIERGWLDRIEVVERLLTTLDFLENADRFRGAWPHWMNGNTGRVIPFSERDNGGDIVETAFLAQGLLAARQYFDQSSVQEDSIRTQCTRLWEGIDWTGYVQPGDDVITWHWSPNLGYAINLKVRGFNETQIVYLLAAASPTHPVDASLYQTGWLRDGYRSFQGRYGIFIPAGPRSGGPMFFAHYSYLGWDPRYWKDEVTNYFVRNQLHAEYQVAYAEDNPAGHEAYSRSCWGLTASDDPERGYAVHEAAEERDNGTITPTAALASMPYVPEDATRALKHFYEEYRSDLYGPYGFYDAFNPSLDWIAASYLAIDQGPIVGMIENHRTGLLWDVFMQNPEIAPALEALGFERDSTSVSSSPVLPQGPELVLSPNPVSDRFGIRFEQSPSTLGEVEVEVLNISGQLSFRQNFGHPTGLVHIDISALPKGSYLVNVIFANGLKSTATLVKQ